MVTLCLLGVGADSQWKSELRAAREALEQGRFAESETHARAALSSIEQSYPSDSPEVAHCLNDLASASAALGKSVEAEKLYRDALRIWQKNSMDEAARARVESNLSAILLDAARYPEAEALALDAVEIDERIFGADHPETAASLNKLGAVYNAEGHYRQAETVLLRAARIREKTLGPRNPNTAMTLAALSQTYWHMGKNARAIELLQDALHSTEQACPVEHPRVALMLNNLSSLYSSQHKYKEAERCAQHAIAIWEKATRFSRCLF